MKKAVSLPSDNLTNAQLRDLAGEVVTYELNRPVDYQSLKAWPPDIAAEYLKGLSEKYGASNKMIGEMLGISDQTVAAMKEKLGFPKGKPGGARAKPDVEGWKAFLAQKPQTQSPPPVSAPEKAATPQPPAWPENKADLIAALFVALRGTGAKITIEVTL